MQLLTKTKSKHGWNQISVWKVCTGNSYNIKQRRLNKINFQSKPSLCFCYTFDFNPLLANVFIIKKQPPVVFYKKSVLKKFLIFTGKHLCWSLFLISSIKKRHEHSYFPVNIVKFLRTPILKSNCKRLRLIILCIWYRKYNHVNNIFRLFDVLANFPFITSETKGDC